MRYKGWLVIVVSVVLIALFGAPVRRLWLSREVSQSITALRSPDAGTSLSAQQALARVGPPAVESLIATLKDPDPKTRQNAAITLGMIDDRRSKDALVSALSDQDGEVRASAISALVRVKDARAIAPLIAGLRMWDRPARALAVQALGQIGEPAVDPLLRALDDPEPAMRWRVADALSLTHNKRAVEPLLKLLTDPSRDVRVSVAEDLTVFKESRVVDALSDAVRSSDPEMRQSAVESLGRLADRRAVPVLIAATSDSNSSVRSSAASSLGQLRDLRAAEPLIAALKDKDASVRANAAYALGLVQSPRTLRALVDALNDPDPETRAAIAQTIGRIGPPAVPALLTAICSPNRRTRLGAMESLALTWDRRSVDPLVAALNSPDPARRLEAAGSAYELYVRMGRPGTDTLMVAALKVYGTQEMARCLLNSGNPTLRAAAEGFVQTRGYDMSAPHWKFGPKWGQGLSPGTIGKRPASSTTQ